MLNWCLLGWLESLKSIMSESNELVESVVAALDSMVAGLAPVVCFSDCWFGLGGGFSWW